MPKPDSVTVVGASLAGLRCVETLRGAGFEGRITLIGEEPHRPYDRPPLSKEVLAGVRDPEDIALRKESYEDLKLEWRLERRAVELDVAERTVVAHDGERIEAEAVVIATGSVPRVLADTPKVAGIFTLRTLDDCLAITELLESKPRVVVIGAGFIGAEVAATCRGRGLEVTVLEALPVPLGRVLGPEMGAACAALHLDHGVDLRCGAGVAAIEGDGQVERVRLSDGTVIDADVVIVGIGVRPATDWLENSGLTISDGVVCDATLAAAPGIYAAGDVCRWPNELFGDEDAGFPRGTMRVEHWTTAAEMGIAAAHRVLAGDDPGAGVPFAPVPFFWSDQYDTKIQFAGRSSADDEVKVVHGSVAERSFVALYGRAGRLVGVLGFSRPRLVMGYRRMIGERASFEDALAVATATSS